MALLRTEHVSKSFGQLEVLKDINLEVEKGEDGVATYISRSFKEILKMKSEKHPDTLFVSHSGDDYTWMDIANTIHNAHFEVEK